MVNRSRSRSLARRQGSSRISRFSTNNDSVGRSEQKTLASGGDGVPVGRIEPVSASRATRDALKLLLSSDQMVVCTALRSINEMLSGSAHDKSMARTIFIARGGLANVYKIISMQLSAFQPSPETIELASIILAKSVQSDTRALTYVVKECGGSNLLLLLKSFSSQPAISLLLAQVLVSVSKFEKESQKLAASSDIILNLIKDHQENGAEILFTLLRLVLGCCRGSALAVEEIPRHAFFEHVLKVVETNLPNKKIVKVGLQILTSLLSRSERNHGTVASEGGVSLLLEIVDFFPEDLVLINSVIVIALKFCDDAQARETLSLYNSFERFQPLVAMYLGNHSMLFKTCKLLWKLAAQPYSEWLNFNQPSYIKLPDGDSLLEKDPHGNGCLFPESHLREESKVNDTCKEGIFLNHRNSCGISDENKEVDSEALSDLISNLTPMVNWPEGNLPTASMFMPEPFNPLESESLAKIDEDIKVQHLLRIVQRFHKFGSSRFQDYADLVFDKNGTFDLFETTSNLAKAKSLYETKSLGFGSDFESGNLSQAIRVGEFEYDLLLSSDTNNMCHTQWFYFAIYGLRRRRKYRFNFLNLEKGDSLFNAGMRPIMFCPEAMDTLGIGWKRVGCDISYYQNPFVKTTNDKKKASCYSISIILKLPEEFAESLDDMSAHYISYCYPYTYRNLMVDLESIESTRKNCMKRTSLCKTIAGNDCPLITITNFETLGSLRPKDSDICESDPEDDPDCDSNNIKDNKNRILPLEERKYIVLSSRVHPGETNSSWMMRGLLKYLTGDSEEAVLLRNRIVFKIVPMINPDGVIVGNHRCNLFGLDLNRKWSKPDKNTSPTIYHLKDLISQITADKGPENLLLFIDMHGHSRRKDLFMFGCQDGKESIENNAALVPHLMSRNCPYFNLDNCSYRVSKAKTSCGRVTVWKDKKIPFSYTMEASLCGSNTEHFHTSHLERMGRDLVRAIWDLVNPDQEVVKDILNSLGACASEGKSNLDSYDIADDDEERESVRSGAKSARKEKSTTGNTNVVTSSRPTRGGGIEERRKKGIDKLRRKSRASGKTSGRSSLGTKRRTRKK